MDNPLLTQADNLLPILVPAGEDRFGEFKIFGISSIAIKLSSQESKDIFAVEITLLQKGGPARHLHYDQDEWWYILEGEFILEIGNERFHARPGNSLFGPRKVPHVWAFATGTRGRFLATVMPSGNLEAFFVDPDKKKTLPGPDQSLWQPFGMEWVGPPLTIE